MTNREWLVKLGRERGFYTRPFTEPNPAFVIPEPDASGIAWVDWQDNATHGESVGIDAAGQLYTRGYGPGYVKGVPEPEHVEGESDFDFLRRCNEYDAKSWGHGEIHKLTIDNHDEWFKGDA